jgi:hypothetical protein
VKSFQSIDARQALVGIVERQELARDVAPGWIIQLGFGDDGYLPLRVRRHIGRASSEDRFFRNHER